VALLNASPGAAFSLGARPWLGAVALDSAALDVVQIMEEPHFPLYDQAFGKNPELWRQASPLHALSAHAAPLLAVCSVRRRSACEQARKFTAQAVLLHARASVLPQDVSHQDANQQLGLPGGYTEAVESFMGSLDASVRQTLSP
jgi:arylformamidase